PVGYLRMHMQEDPPPFRAVKPDLPALPQLESVVMKALTKDRNQRYGSVLEFAHEFALAAQNNRSRHRGRHNCRKSRRRTSSPLTTKMARQRGPLEKSGDYRFGRLGSWC